MGYYERDGLKAAIIISLILFMLALGAGGYFYITETNTQISIEQIQQIDYSVQSIAASKEPAGQRPGFSALSHSQAAVTENTYMTPLGFPIESYSEKWKGDKLVEIYEELIQNKHGEEMNYISRIVVNGGMSEMGTKDSVVAGAHSSTQENYQVFLDVPGVVPSSLNYRISSKQSVIELFNMDEYDTIEEAARTIAHEYGHHYTIFYFMQDDEQVKESDYYNLRSFSEFEEPIFFTNRQDYFENHMWSIYEVAAEDYVQLMGSPNVIRTQEYLDLYEVLQSGQKNYSIYADSNTSNVFPQENMTITLASQVAGLRSYYYSFIEEESNLDVIAQIDFGISMKRRSSNGYIYYDITWNNVYAEEDVLYTLLCYDADMQIYSPIKTITGSEKPIAKVGTVSKVSGNQIIYFSNDVTKEDRYFRLIVILPDGRIMGSEYYFAEF